MKFIYFIISLVFTLVVGVFLFLIIKTYYIPKVGYVKVAVLMERYKGMIDAGKTFESDYKIAQSNLDTVRNRYIALKNSKPSMATLKQADMELNEYQMKFSEEMGKRQTELSRPAVERINAYILDYGKKHHYKLILGATLEGNILYGEDTDDLTQILLTDLNNIYEKKANK